MNTIKLAISQEDAEYHLDLLLDIAEDLFQRYAYLTLWRIRRWDYEGFSGDYFHWPYAGSLHDISFIEELVWVLHETGHEIYEDAYASHLSQACRPVVKLLSDAEESVLMAVVCQDADREVTVSEITSMIESRLLTTIMGIARGSDMQGIRETWTFYGLAYEMPEDEED